MGTQNTIMVGNILLVGDIKMLLIFYFQLLKIKGFTRNKKKAEVCDML